MKLARQGLKGLLDRIPVFVPQAKQAEVLLLGWSGQKICHVLLDRRQAVSACSTTFQVAVS